MDLSFTIMVMDWRMIWDLKKSEEEMKLIENKSILT